MKTYLQLNPLSQRILAVLSFYQAMDSEQILMELDIDARKDRELTYQDFLDSLQQLKKCGVVKYQKNERGEVWMRIFPQKPWWRRWCQWW